MWTIFEIGSVWFYVLIVVINFALFVCVAGEKLASGWATICVLATFGALYFMGGDRNKYDLLHHIIQHPFETIFLFLLYVFVGVLWSFVEWFWYVKKQAELYEDKEISEYNIPKASNERGRLFTWIFYWPWTMLWKITHKPIERLFDVIMQYTGKTYENITKKAFSKIQIKK